MLGPDCRLRANSEPSQRLALVLHLQKSVQSGNDSLIKASKKTAEAPSP